MSNSEPSDGGSLFCRIYQLDGEIPQYEVIDVKIKKVQKKIAKYTKKLEKYLDLLAELTAAKEIVAEATMEKAKVALPDKPVETPAAEQPKPIRSRRATSSKKSAERRLHSSVLRHRRH